MIIFVIVLCVINCMDHIKQIYPSFEHFLF
jgi:hypothetical protein